MDFVFVLSIFDVSVFGRNLSRKEDTVQRNQTNVLSVRVIRDPETSSVWEQPPCRIWAQDLSSGVEWVTAKSIGQIRELRSRVRSIEDSAREDDELEHIMKSCKVEETEDEDDVVQTDDVVSDQADKTEETSSAIVQVESNVSSEERDRKLALFHYLLSHDSVVKKIPKNAKTEDPGDCVDPLAEDPLFLGISNSLARDSLFSSDVLSWSEKPDVIQLQMDQMCRHIVLSSFLFDSFPGNKPEEVDSGESSAKSRWRRRRQRIAAATSASLLEFLERPGLSDSPKLLEPSSVLLDIRQYVLGILNLPPLARLIFFSFFFFLLFF